MSKFGCLVLLVFSVILKDAASALQCKTGSRYVLGGGAEINAEVSSDCPESNVCLRGDFTATFQGQDRKSKSDCL